MTLSYFRKLSFVVALALLALPAAVWASASTGGASMPDEPEVDNAVCEDASVFKCARGARLTLTGASLADVEQVVFKGRRGKRDDRVASPDSATDDSVTVIVPRGAKSGPIAVVGDAGKAVTPQPVTVTKGAAPRAASPPSAGHGVFPILGKHTYGDGLGAGRGHQGQDVFAKCGTTLVAVYDVVVQHKAFQSRAGNYVVLQASDGQSFAYMHMQAPASVGKGDVLKAGDPVGKVGQTGRATGCHLHFEQWTAPGWYEGGHAVDPTPLLKSLDK